jgi:hypothetical protein
MTRDPWGQFVYSTAEVAALGMNPDDRTLCRVLDCFCGSSVEGRLESLRVVTATVTVTDGKR